MKIKHFTHTDFDGVGCAAILKAAHPNDTVDIEYCNYDKINEKVNAFLDTNDIDEYNSVYITDISVSKEVALRIDSLGIINRSKFILLDHHKTAAWLNKYIWAHVYDIEVKGDVEIKTSGTSLLYYYLEKNGDLQHILNRGNIEIFAELARLYDTWDWTLNENYSCGQDAKDWNDILYMIPRKEFLELAIAAMQTDYPTVPESYQTVLRVEKQRIDAYIKKKAKTIDEMNFLTYLTGVVFAENYISELGNELAKLNPHLDFITIINPSSLTVSFRTVHDHLDLGKDVAGILGGGGHPKSAGAKLMESELIRLVLKSEFLDRLPYVETRKDEV